MKQLHVTLLLLACGHLLMECQGDRVVRAVAAFLAR